MRKHWQILLCCDTCLLFLFLFPQPELRSWDVPILSFSLFSLSRMCKCHVRGILFCQKAEHSTYCLLGSGHDFCPKENNLCLFWSFCVPSSQPLVVRFVGNAQEQSVWVSLTNVPDSDISLAMLILPCLRASLIPSKAQGIPWCSAQWFSPCCCTLICAAQLSAADCQPNSWAILSQKQQQHRGTSLKCSPNPRLLPKSQAKTFVVTQISYKLGSALAF